jgi:hypothetical protein
MSADLGLPGTPAVGRSPVLLVRRRSGLLVKVADVLQDNVFVVLVLSAVAALQVALSRSEIASDAWYTLLGGRTVAHSGLPHHEVLTVLAHGRRWVDQQWLGHLVLYGLWDAGGWPLATLSIVAMFTGALALCATSARSLGASERSTSLILLACFLVGVPNTALRAQVVAYPLFSLVLLLLLADERRPSRRVFLVFPLLVLWANVHGSIVVGAALVALRGATIVLSVSRRRAPAAAFKRAAILVLAPWACVLASPYALELPGYYHRTLANPTFGRIVVEWTPSTIRNEPIFYAALLLAAWLGLGRGRALGAFGRLALAFTAVGGLLAIRNIVWFALVGAAVLPRALDAAWPPRRTGRHRRLNLVLVASAFLGLSITAAATAAHGHSWFEHGFPGRAAATVAAATETDPNAKVFANDRYADWLLFKQPRLRGKIAYDIRFELFNGRELQGIYDFTLQRGPHWRRIARGYSILVLDPVQQRGVLDFYRHRLHAEPLYRDRDVAVVKLPTGAAP